MKNADMPAMPVLNGDNEPANMGSKYYQDASLATGLTKREMMAMHMMQGLISVWGQHDVTSSEELVSDAVTMADLLLAELERTK